MGPRPALLVLGLVLHSLLTTDCGIEKPSFRSFGALASPVGTPESQHQTLLQDYDDTSAFRPTYFGDAPIRRPLHGRFLHITDIVCSIKRVLRVRTATSLTTVLALYFNF